MIAWLLTRLLVNVLLSACACLLTRLCVGVFVCGGGV